MLRIFLISSTAAAVFLSGCQTVETTQAGVVGVTEYGIPFCSVYARDNLVATQFHPEKSGALGLRIYENFVAFTRDYAARKTPAAN